MTPTIIFILIISFIASLVRSTLGFGESLIAVPLFLLFLPVNCPILNRTQVNNWSQPEFLDAGILVFDTEYVPNILLEINYLMMLEIENLKVHEWITKYTQNDQPVFPG